LSSAFKFRLDKLLEIRMEEEEESKRIFNENSRKKQFIEDKLEELNQNYDKYKGINPDEDVVYQKLKRYYIKGLQDGIAQTEKDLVKQSREVEKRRVQLKEKQIKRKTVEVLKDKKKMEFLREQDRIEQVTIDELALYSYMRNENNI